MNPYNGSTSKTEAGGTRVQGETELCRFYPTSNQTNKTMITTQRTLNYDVVRVMSRERSWRNFVIFKIFCSRRNLNVNKIV